MKDPDPIEGIQQKLDELLAGRAGLTILDAGCGSRLAVQFAPHSRIIGIDNSRAQLERNKQADVKILGDIQNDPLPPHLDVVLCWDVLEHLPKPERALNNFFLSLKPGGLIVLKSPNRNSVKGMLTAFTPLWFHVWYYRRVLGRKWKGTDERGPFRTYLRRTMKPRAVRCMAEERGFSLSYLSLFENKQQVMLRRRFHLVGLPWRTVKLLVRALTFGRLSAEETDYCMILQKGTPRPSSTGSVPSIVW